MKIKKRLLHAFTNRLNQHWQNIGWLNLVLLPLAGLFTTLVATRHFLYKKGKLSVYRSPVPVIVVGNLTVGGNGKTPLVIWLSEKLSHMGYHPGIISRGYKGKSKHWPVSVDPETNPKWVGDEPVLLAQRTGKPVYVAPKRAVAIQKLLQTHPRCNIILSDDGMQHYAMARDIEIAVFDAKHGFGNGLMLPAGPLRETPSRLQNVDLCIKNGPATEGYTMQLRHPVIAPLNGTEPKVDLHTWQGRTVYAIAGIGYPERFFNLLTSYGLIVKAQPMPDHYSYQMLDFDLQHHYPVLMTEKDAVKCRQLNLPQAWVVSVQAEPEEAWVEKLEHLLSQKAPLKL